MKAEHCKQVPRDLTANIEPSIYSYSILGQCVFDFRENHYRPVLKPNKCKALTGIDKLVYKLMYKLFNLHKFYEEAISELQYCIFC